MTQRLRKPEMTSTHYEVGEERGLTSKNCWERKRQEVSLRKKRLLLLAHEAKAFQVRSRAGDNDDANAVRRSKIDRGDIKRSTASGGRE